MKEFVHESQREKVGVSGCHKEYFKPLSHSLSLLLAYFSVQSVLATVFSSEVDDLCLSAFVLKLILWLPKKNLHS